MIRGFEDDGRAQRRTPVVINHEWCLCWVIRVARERYSM